MGSELVRLLRPLEAMMRWFDATNVRAAIIGGVAASLLGKPRLTKDIDAVVLDVDAQVLIESGAPYGFLPRIADAVDFARNTRMVLLRFTEGAIDIDLSLGALPFEYEVIERSSMIDVSPGVSIRVASPEDIIIMKAVAGRGRDITDRVRSTAAARMNPIPVPMRPNVAATCDGCRAPRVPLCRNEPERVSSHSH